MKKKILFNPIGGSQWIGGLYYLKNILFGVLQNDRLNNKCEFTIFMDQKNKDLFCAFDGKVNVYTYKDKWKKISRAWVMFQTRTNLVYPVTSANWNLSKLRKHPIFWIPDFQHNLLPEFFDSEERKQRSDVFTKIAKSRYPLVLSSQDAKKDFEQFYPLKKNVYVMPFVSYIEPELKQLTSSKEHAVLQKFDLTNTVFACISNQFWQHKNHIIVVKAIREWKVNYPQDELKFIFTGELKDYRNTEYYQKLRNLFSESDIQESSVVLGFIDRMEQLVLMKHAKFILQPSLFEGWGTVLEDAKVLDKLVLLSDIPVHREQKNENCILFNPYKAEELAECIHTALHKNHKDNIEKGIKQMYASAKEYSNVFLHLLEDFEQEEKKRRWHK